MTRIARRRLTRRNSLIALSLLTPATVLQAKDEIRTGVRVQVDWQLNALKYTLHGRQSLKQNIVDLKGKNGMFAHDDEVTFNTQASSQWVWPGSSDPAREIVLTSMRMDLAIARNRAPEYTTTASTMTIL